TLGAFAARRVRFDRVRRASLMRITAHVGAALRLRSRQSMLRRPCAVVAPDGCVRHAEGELRAASARDALTQAVRAMERARGAMRRTRPDDALEAWRALVAGRWSVVEWIDVDGRRYLVAHENRLALPDPRALGEREREVAEYLVHGRSGSEIAY